MELFLLSARLLLALVFGVAGIAKAADLAGSRRAMIGFGVPGKLAASLGLGLPFAEILIALALIPLNSAWLGAIAAFTLLTMFAVGIVVSLARGTSPDCHCFGQLHSEPVGWLTLARNLGLIAVAGLIIVEGKNNVGLSALNWLGDLKAGEIVGLALGIVSVALLAVTFAHLRRVLNQHTSLVEKIDAMKKVIDEDYAEAPVERAEAAPPAEGLPIGAPAPEFTVASIRGEQVTLDDLLEYGRPVLLLFISPTCAPCKTLLPAVKDWERDYGDQLTVAVLSKGEAGANQSWLSENGIKYALLQSDSDVAAEYEAKWTPAAVIIRSDGRIGSSVAYGDEPIRALVTRAVSPVEGKKKRSLPIKGNGHKPQLIIGREDALRDLGQPLPRFSLRDVNGDAVNSEEFLGRDTLLLFWEPKCPFCQAMSGDVASWEENPPKGAPRLVFVSSGEEEAVRAESGKFTSRFLYDPELEVSLLFGTNLTPSAVLIDRTGRIASPPTAGRLEILTLAGVRKSAAPVASVHEHTQPAIAE